MESEYAPLTGRICFSAIPFITARQIAKLHGSGSDYPRSSSVQDEKCEFARLNDPAFNAEMAVLRGKQSGCPQLTGTNGQ